MANRLTSQEKTRLILTVRDLFGETENLHDFLESKLERSLPGTSRIRDIRIRTKVMLDEAENEGWLAELLTELRAGFPEDESILNAYRRLFPRNRRRSGAERRVNNMNFDYPAVMRRKSWEIENRICRIEIDYGLGMTPTGTGFLIGPDLVLTNYHVLKPVFLGEVPMKKVYFSFDRKMSADGLTLGNAITVQAVADNPVLSHSPGTPEDDLGLDLDQSWGEDEFDFAVVKLSLRMGETRPGTQTKAADGQASRGWVNIPPAEVSSKPGHKLIIYQHPGGDLLREAVGQFLTPSVFNASGSRFRYTTNTEAGSSGAPCFNHEWKLVGIHHYGDPINDIARYNQGIPIDKIRARMEADGVPIEQFEDNIASGRESIREIISPEIEAVVAGNLDLDEFSKIAEKVVTNLPDAEGKSDSERIKTILKEALRRGKLKRLLETTEHELPDDQALHQLIQNFTEVHDDPCEAILLKGYRLFFNRKNFRDAVRRLDEPTEPQTVYIQGEPKSGHSQTFWYLHYLKENSDLLDELVLLDLREISQEEEISEGKLFFTRPVVAGLIFKALGLPEEEWDEEYKSRDFCNALIGAMKNETRRFALVLDGFRHAGSMTENLVYDMIQMMVKKVDRELSNFHIFLVDFQSALDPEVHNHITTDELEVISQDELLDGIQSLYVMREKKFPGRTFTDEDIARTYLELTRGKGQTEFLAGELSPQDVKIARSLLN